MNTYLIIAAISIITIFGLIKSIRGKRYFALLSCLFIIPFDIFFISILIFGGSAFNSASSSYSLYQAGHYYLNNHGHYTEVAYGVFLYMQICEVVGIISVGIGLVLSAVEAIRSYGFKNHGK